jgi:hypothetical protein
VVTGSTIVAGEFDGQVENAVGHGG